jgi:hypothetical protein
MTTDLRIFLDKVIQDEAIINYELETIAINDNVTLDTNEILLFVDYIGTSFEFSTENDIFNDSQPLRIIVIKSFIEFTTLAPFPFLSCVKITILDTCN